MVKIGARRVQARQLVRPTMRAIRWAPFAAVLALGALVIGVGRFAGRPPAFANLPALAVVLAACMGFVFDDEAAPTTVSSPTPLLVTRGIRVAVGFPVVLVAWGAGLAFADQGWVSLSLTAGFVAACCVALGASAVGVALVGRTRAGLLAGVVVGFVFFVVPTAFRVPLGLGPSSDTWGHLYGRWILVGTLGAGVAVIASGGHVVRGVALPVRDLVAPHVGSGSGAR